ncbi:Hypothetical predicted protein [Olea europaea subsp. europaea]|uniref:Uncharacterized protein n=1 Tax=Olea europaea subsp. europaea TaxID=158383 RepID=A0A8S0TR15_OLEEU|nr:Hypothetical predicted protein [Olea europaea subsp. europaea]
MNANEESQTQLTHPRFQVLQIASYADTHHHRLIQTKPRMNNNFVAKDQWEFKKGKLKKVPVILKLKEEADTRTRGRDRRAHGIRPMQPQLSACSVSLSVVYLLAIEVEASLGPDDAPSGELLCRLEIMCIAPGLASGMRERSLRQGLPNVCLFQPFHFWQSSFQKPLVVFTSLDIVSQNGFRIARFMTIKFMRFDLSHFSISLLSLEVLSSILNTPPPINRRLQHTPATPHPIPIPFQHNTHRTHTHHHHIQPHHPSHSIYIQDHHTNHINQLTTTSSDLLLTKTRPYILLTTTSSDQKERKNPQILSPCRHRGLQHRNSIATTPFVAAL